MIYPSTVFSLIVGPIRVEVFNGRTILTHLQKLSRCGFLFTWPFCFHFWFMWKKQEVQIIPGFDDPYFVPGSEKGIYIRTPGYRWDTTNGMNWTWGYCGLHWD